MSYIIGMLFGSILGIAILSLLLSLFAYKSFEPTKRALATVLTALTIAVVVYGSQDGGRYGEALIFYGIGAFVIFFERQRHYRKNWTDDSDLTETFR